MRKFFLVLLVPFFIVTGTGCSSNITRMDSNVNLLHNAANMQMSVDKSMASRRVAELAINHAEQRGSDLVENQRATIKSMDIIGGFVREYVEIKMQEVLEEKK